MKEKIIVLGLLGVIGSGCVVREREVPVTGVIVEEKRVDVHHHDEKEEDDD